MSNISYYKECVVPQDKREEFVTQFSYLRTIGIADLEFEYYAALGFDDLRWMESKHAYVKVGGFLFCQSLPITHPDFTSIIREIITVSEIELPASTTWIDLGRARVEFFQLIRERLRMVLENGTFTQAQLKMLLLQKGITESSKCVVMAHLKKSKEHEGCIPSTV